MPSKETKPPIAEADRFGRAERLVEIEEQLRVSLYNALHPRHRGTPQDWDFGPARPVEMVDGKFAFDVRGDLSLDSVDVAHAIMSLEDARHWLDVLEYEIVERAVSEHGGDFRWMRIDSWLTFGDLGVLFATSFQAAQQRFSRWPGVVEKSWDKYRRRHERFDQEVAKNRQWGPASDFRRLR